MIVELDNDDCDFKIAIFSPVSHVNLKGNATADESLLCGNIFGKTTRKVLQPKCCVLHSLTRSWDSSTPDRMGDNYEALCNQGRPCNAEHGLMSQYVTPELQGSKANQPPRRFMKGTFTQALHHPARMKAITSPFPCAPIFTPSHHLWLLNQHQHAQLTEKHWMESKAVIGCNQIKCEKQKKKWILLFISAQGLFQPFFF